MLVTRPDEASLGSPSAPKRFLRIPTGLHMARGRFWKRASRAPMELDMARRRLGNARYGLRWSFAWLAVGSEMFITSADGTSRGSPSVPRSWRLFPSRLGPARQNPKSKNSDAKFEIQNPESQINGTKHCKFPNPENKSGAECAGGGGNQPDNAGAATISDKPKDNATSSDGASNGFLSVPKCSL